MRPGMHRVLGNLLTNAIKYSPNGGAVRVTVKTTDGSRGKSTLLVVRDGGVGIPPNDPTSSTGSIEARTSSDASPALALGSRVRVSLWNCTEAPSR